MKKPIVASLIVITALLFALGGCKDNPVEPDETHAEAEGLVLRMNGVDIVIVREGTVTGHISVPNGTETDHIDVYFLDHADTRFRPEGSEYDLGWSIADTSVAAIERDPGEKWGIHVIGKAVQTTSVEIRLLHHDHADFRTPSIPIHVTTP
jgi:hypothetical protein